jgi:hypothetical protein
VHERRFQLGAAAADVARFLLDLEFGGGVDQGARFIGALAVGKNLAGQDRALCFFARGEQTALDEQEIEARLHCVCAQASS